MATFTATIYYPGQKPQVLKPADVAALAPRRIELNERLYLVGDQAQVAEWLCTEELPDALACHYTAALYGIFDYCDDEALNPDADPETLRLFNITGLFGPLLLIEETIELPAPAERDEYAYHGEESWSTYHEARASRLGL